MFSLSKIASAIRVAFGPLYLQGDQAVANQAGAAFRADMNSELQSIVTNSSGASSPSTTYAYQWWADTTNGLLKQRNAANSAWVVRGTLAETFVIARSSNTIIGVGDYGRTFVCTSSFTQTLTAAATLADGFWCEFRNDGTGTITFDPNGAETIDGVATLDLLPGESCIINCNGSAFKTVGRAPQLPPGSTTDFAGSTVPTGWLLCDGAAVSRTTYANLFAAISTTWGAGDGSTTFNVPDAQGRVAIGAGTAVVAETASTSVAANAQLVTSNTKKWITGMCVRVSSSGTLPTGLAAATDYFIYRVDATHVSFCTSLANAQNATVITISGGSGNITITTAGATAQSFATHALGEGGGEENHAQSSTELLAHTHNRGAQVNVSPSAATLVSNSTDNAGSAISTTGGNVAMNVMQTYATFKKIIKI